MGASSHHTTFIYHYRPPGMAEQLLQHAIDILLGETRPVHQVDVRDDEFPPISEDGNASSQFPFTIRTMANGALDMRVRDGDLDPRLLGQAVVRTSVEARVLEAESRALEAKSRSVL
ncbi:hypothetical protein B0T25DRAFT_563383 [Lasiosphaeria hispida]|uniref:Uncharacterized protein n=1 Tax=Lasiosphaeria hispida TaxID=260671 RepID=A0AAJ0HXC7_9PEZI|nr:hypothetical protein B0T25DRAFT_563383 [Lasiosphaeria hispida]